MKPFDWRSLVVSSIIVLAAMQAANAETRPQYGGTMRVAMQAAPMSLDPADLLSATLHSGNMAQPDSFARRSLAMLLFDTLVTVDENFQIQPALATSWQAMNANQRWQFRIRDGVKFHDGTPLSAEVAAGALRAANPAWKVSTEGDSIVIVRNESDPELPAELALPRNAIVKRNPDNTLSGTGPFHIVDWRPGQKLAVAAHEDCWRGRPYLDGIEIEMGKSLRDQIVALELGKADLVEVSAEQAHRIRQEGRRLSRSMPVELVALLFSRDASSPAENDLRATLALSVERGSMRAVLLQGEGQPTASLLPNWMSGFGFVFPVEADLSRARHLREQVHAVPNWTLGYDGRDGVARLLAERVALNAKDAGLSMQPTQASTTDLKLVRIPLASPDAWVALAKVASQAGIPVGRLSGTAEELYASELAFLGTQRIIPLFHLPVCYGATTSLKNWSVRPDGSWNVGDAWLGIENHDR